MTTAIKTYTCIGSVRGSCDVQHRSLAAADRCCRKDQAECSRQGGYSDRSVRNGDGSQISEQDYSEMVWMSRS